MVLGVHREESEAESVYKVIEIIGTSPKSWAEAGKAAVERASKTLRDLCRLAARAAAADAF